MSTRRHACAYCDPKREAMIYDRKTKRIKAASFRGAPKGHLEAALQHLCALAQNRMLEFPWKRHIYPVAHLARCLATFSEMPYVVNVDPYTCVNLAWRAEEGKPWTSAASASEYCPGPLVSGLASGLPEPRHLTILIGRDWYDKYHIIADCYTEHVRLAARRVYQRVSPFQTWRRPSGYERALSQCAKTNQGFSPYWLREAMYPWLKECETFKASLAYLVYTKLFARKAVNILDPCAGWGDRLVAAMASGSSYTGVDANPSLGPCYQAIIRDLASATVRGPGVCETKEEKEEEEAKSRSCALISAPQYHVYTDCFLKCKEVAKHGPYDLIFTCPPYWCLEIYNETDVRQSIQQHPTLDAWKSKWFFPSLAKAWSLLLDGGHMVIVINDFSEMFDKQDKQDMRDEKATTRAAYCQDMVSYCVGQLESCAFLGMVSYANGDALAGCTGVRQPMWVFRKAATVTPSVESRT